MTIEASYPCSICGDQVPQCPTLIRDGSCEDCFEGEHDNGFCNCCYGAICPKHTAHPSCPHRPADHDDAPARARAGEEGG